MRNFVIKSMLPSKISGAELEYISVANTNIVLFINSDGEVLLVRQYREIFSSNVLELPGGGSDLGEVPLKAAIREFLEETGIQLRSAKSLLRTALSLGTSDEFVNIFLALESDVVHRNGTPESGMELIWMSISNAMNRLKNESIIDAKTMLALSYYIASFK
jgi:ADP-ribose pyrophosphatase